MRGERDEIRTRGPLWKSGRDLPIRRAQPGEVWAQRYRYGLCGCFHAVSEPIGWLANCCPVAWALVHLILEPTLRYPQAIKVAERRYDEYLTETGQG